VLAILDDEPEMLKALRRLLTCCGFVVEEYKSGEDLLAAIDSHPLDCLLLDLHMPYHIGKVIEKESSLLVATKEMFTAVFGIDCRTNCEAVAIDAKYKTVDLLNVTNGEVTTESYDKLVLSGADAATAVGPPPEAGAASDVIPSPATDAATAGVPPSAPDAATAGLPPPRTGAATVEAPP